MKLPKISIKKTLIGIWIIGTIVLLGFVVNFGLEKVKETSYQQGFQEGQNTIINQIKAGMRINFDDGIILFISNQ